MESIFKDLKVIELASVLAGPAVGLFFAELGADVIKIENKKTGGDVTRTWRLPSEDKTASVSAYYCAINWKKEVQFLDLSTEEGKNAVYELVKTADVVVANYKKQSAQKLGMDYEHLKAIRPELIYANISGFGEESERVAFDVVLQAESGFMYMNGQADGPPTKMPVALIDVLAAHQLKEGILVALLQRYKTGQGAYVSVSLLEAAVASLANQATNWLMGKHIPQRMGSLHPNIAPYGELFETKDAKRLILSIGSDRQFVNLCTCINRPDLLENENYQTNIARVKHRVVLAKELSQTFKGLIAEDILERCHQKFVPIGQVRNMQEVFEQPTAQKMILEEEVDGLLTQRVRTAAFKIN
ncbi:MULTISPECIES: CaiB/BaiF CoA-transferase family protein [unclassified Aureispira]|uniref:CaiB/BaiF CoA transferase family protein n=1 Tax=unclassified Aureispira TaxID=2649989 RepID=UPI00069655A4|nr:MULTISPECIES: CaiB/BaiF CoA-transferase family protein [unclassified Aureispira]WMX12846.1 CaiB/BaiF CoA-transferase family protein [Aureispira sp. CCB-E]